jgi:hypothetical protein
MHWPSKPLIGVRFPVPAPNSERWPSGLRHPPTKRTNSKMFRGFESHPFRHTRRNMDSIYFGPALGKAKLDISDINTISKLAENTSNDISYDLAGQLDFQKLIESNSSSKIFDILEPYIVEYLKSFGKLKYDKDLDFSFFSTSLWLNKQRKNDYNPMHRHGTDLSFVLYLDIPDEIHNEEPVGQNNPPGSIEFTYGKDLFGHNYRNFLDPKINYVHTPVNGDFFIFSSSLYHQVTAFKSDVTRVSLAGNTCFKHIERNT